jgi:hypothetical protein
MTDRDAKIAAAKVKLGEGVPIVFTSPVSVQPGSYGRGLIEGWALPLLWMWRRHVHKGIRSAAGEALGVPLQQLNLLVVTDDRLLFWSVKRTWRRGRLHRHPHRLLGHVDRDDVRGVTNNTVGRGWRTCRLTLGNGREASLRVPATHLDQLVAVFGQPARDQA